MGAAEDDVDEQHTGSDDQRRHRFEPEHDLEHDEARHELSGDVEEQDQREDRNQQPDAVAPVAVTQVLGDRAVAELVAGVRDEPDRDQDPEVDPHRVEELAPDARHPELVAEAGAAEEGGAAGRRGGERQGQEVGAVAAPRGGEIVGVADPPAGDPAERQHADDVEDEEHPRPGKQTHRLPPRQFGLFLGTRASCPRSAPGCPTTLSARLSRQSPRTRGACWRTARRRTPESRGSGSCRRRPGPAPG